ncbi:MAG: helix-turn-helix domain-containing protein [Paenibacillaceae bacterium]|nr:helix-turn-helix domain-containing protein [Paenibacillaceae bacterium]
MRSSYRLRLLVFSLMISIVPVLVMGVFSYHRSAQDAQRQSESGNGQVLLQKQLRVEQTLRAIDFSLTQFITTPLINNSLNWPLTLLQFRDTEDLKTALYRLQTFELGIRDIVLINYDEGWSISNAGLEFHPDATEMQDLRAYARQPAPSSWTSALDGQTDEWWLVKNLPVNSLQPRGVLIAKIGADSLRRLVSTSRDNAATLLFDPNGKLIAQNGAYDNGDLYESVSAALADRADAAVRFELPWHGQTMVVQSSPSALNGWRYVSVYSIQEVTRDASRIAWFTVSICTLMIAAIAWFAFWGTRLMYRPVRRLHEALGFAETGTSAGATSPAAAAGYTEPERRRRRMMRDEMSVLFERASSLNTNQTRLAERIRKQAGHLEEYFLMRAYQGLVRPADITETLGQFGYSLASERLCVAVVRIESLEHAKFADCDLDLLLFAVNNMVCDIVPTAYRCKPIAHAGMQVSLLRSAGLDDRTFREQLDAMLTRIRDEVARLLHVGISIGVSSPFQGADGMAAAYEEAVRALTWRIRLGSGAILYWDDVRSGPKVVVSLPADAERRLFEAVRQADAGEVSKALRECLGAIYQESAEVGRQRLCAAQLLAGLLRVVQESGETADSFPPLQANLYEQLFQLTSAQEIEQWFFRAVIAPAIARLRERQEDHYTQIVRQVMAFVQEEAAEQITLEECAQRLNYHPDYVSRVFRSRTGKNFTDYVSDYRMSTARRLLRETDLQVQAVAARIGYTNSQNFIRHFRKMVGMTPGQYRELDRPAASKRA